MQDDEAVVVDLWAQYEPGATAKRRGRPKAKPIEHPQLGTLHAGASDQKGHRTTLAVPQDLADRAQAWQARLHGTPFATHQGMLRHGLHLVLDMLDQCDDVMLNPELRTWIEMDKIQAMAEQDVMFSEAMNDTYTKTVGSLEAAVKSDDVELLRRRLEGAVKALGVMSPRPKAELKAKIKEYQRKLDDMQS